MEDTENEERFALDNPWVKEYTKHVDTLDLSNLEMTVDIVKLLAGLPTLTKLVAENCKLTDEMALLLSTSKSLTYLDVTDNGITETGALQLIQSPYLKTLIIGYNPINPNNIMHVTIPDSNLRRLDITAWKLHNVRPLKLPPFVNPHTITHLNLDRCGINDTQAEVLATESKLVSLSAADNDIKDKGIAALCGIETLQELNVRVNFFGDEGLKSIANNTNLVSVNVGWSRHTVSAVQYFMRTTNAQILRMDDINDKATNASIDPFSDGLMDETPIFTNVTELHLDKIRGINKKVCIVLAALPKLQKLFLRHCFIGDDAAIALASSESITVLDLSECGIDTKGANALAKNSVLKVLNLALNSIDDDSAMVLAANKNLVYLDLSTTSITDSGASKFALNTSLVELHLDNNALTDRTIVSVAKNTTLRVLSLRMIKDFTSVALVTLAKNTTLLALNIQYEGKDKQAEHLFKNRTLIYLECDLAYELHTLFKTNKGLATLQWENLLALHYIPTIYTDHDEIVTRIVSKSNLTSIPRLHTTFIEADNRTIIYDSLASKRIYANVLRNLILNEDPGQLRDFLLEMKETNIIFIPVPDKVYYAQRMDIPERPFDWVLQTRNHAILRVMLDFGFDKYYDHAVFMSGIRDTEFKDIKKMDTVRIKMDIPQSEVHEVMFNRAVLAYESTWYRNVLLAYEAMEGSIKEILELGSFTDVTDEEVLADVKNREDSKKHIEITWKNADPLALNFLKRHINERALTASELKKMPARVLISLLVLTTVFKMNVLDGMLLNAIRSRIKILIRRGTKYDPDQDPTRILDMDTYDLHILYDGAFVLREFSLLPSAWKEMGYFKKRTPSSDESRSKANLDPSSQGVDLSVQFMGMPFLNHALNTRDSSSMNVNSTGGDMDEDKGEKGQQKKKLLDEDDIEQYPSLTIWNKTPRIRQSTHMIVELDVTRISIRKEMIMILMTFKNLVKLEARSCGINNELAKHMAGLQMLQYLDVSDNVITNVGLKELVSMPRLETLIIKANEPSPTSFAFEFMSKSNITTLDISNNGGFNASIYGIFALRNSLTTLICRNNGVNDEVIEVLMDNKNLTHLDVAYNGITNAGAGFLAEHEKLTVLNIESNDLTDDGVVLLSRMSSLKEMYVAGNRVKMNTFFSGSDNEKLEKLSFSVIRPQEWRDSDDAKARSMAEKSRMTELTLTPFILDEIKHSLDPYGASIISAVISLDSLFLAENDIKDEGAIALAKLPNLRILDVSSNGIRYKGAKALAKSTSLEKLVIKYNKLDDRGVGSLGRNTSITYLDLTGVSFTEVGAYYLRHNKALKRLIANNCDLEKIAVFTLAQNENLDTLKVTSSETDTSILPLFSKFSNAWDAEMSGVADKPSLALSNPIFINLESASPFGKIWTTPIPPFSNLTSTVGFLHPSIVNDSLYHAYIIKNATSGAPINDMLNLHGLQNSDVISIGIRNFVYDILFMRRVFAQLLHDYIVSETKDEDADSTLDYLLSIRGLVPDIGTFLADDEKFREWFSLHASEFEDRRINPNSVFFTRNFELDIWNRNKKYDRTEIMERKNPILADLPDRPFDLALKGNISTLFTLFDYGIDEAYRPSHFMHILRTTSVHGRETTDVITIQNHELSFVDEFNVLALAYASKWYRDLVMSRKVLTLTMHDLIGDNTLIMESDEMDPYEAIDKKLDETMEKRKVHEVEWEYLTKGSFNFLHEYINERSDRDFGEEDLYDVVSLFGLSLLLRMPVLQENLFLVLKNMITNLEKQKTKYDPEADPTTIADENELRLHVLYDAMFVYQEYEVLPEGWRDMPYFKKKMNPLYHKRPLPSGEEEERDFQEDEMRQRQKMKMSTPTEEQQGERDPRSGARKRHFTEVGVQFASMKFISHAFSSLAIKPAQTSGLVSDDKLVYTFDMVLSPISDRQEVLHTQLKLSEDEDVSRASIQKTFKEIHSFARPNETLQAKLIISGGPRKDTDKFAAETTVCILNKAKRIIHELRSGTTAIVPIKFKPIHFQFPVENQNINYALLGAIESVWPEQNKGLLDTYDKFKKGKLNSPSAQKPKACLIM